MTRGRRVVVYVTRENPQTALDEFVVLGADELEPDGGRIVRELGVAGGVRYVHAALANSLPAADELAWETLRPNGGHGPFADALVRQRVVVYATRERDDRTELLTIEAAEFPEDPIQVPAGRIDYGETLEDGVRRELAEETGLTAIRIVRELPNFECTYRTYSHNHAFHVAVEEETPDVWEHRVHGTGVDAGFTHRCRWVPLTEDLQLWDAGDPMLAKLAV